MAQILIIEDEPIQAANLKESLEIAGHHVISVQSGEKGLAAADTNPIDVVLLDLRLPGIDGLEVIRGLRSRGHRASVITMTAHGDVNTAVEIMKSGAADYLSKPIDADELTVVVDRILQHRRVSDALDYFRERERAGSAFTDIIGDSPLMQNVKRFVQRLVSTPALASDQPPTVLLTGETGTGKDLIARAIHFAGARRDAPFVHVNCTALPEHLVESELFGHVKGAFTDARTEKRGLFEVADGGSVFLDEIGHMPHSLQAKLLGALENRSIRPVGGSRERRIDVHLMAATNRNLEDAIQAGQFREDLYHRLRVLRVELPPLRDRGDDVIKLAEHFLGMYGARFGIEPQGFSADAIEVLQNYDWPGNVRELSHIVESAVLIADGPTIQPEHLSIRAPEPGGRLQLDINQEQSIAVDFSQSGPKLDEIEYRIIKAALEFSKHNLSRAARILGISRDAVRYRLDRFEKSHGEPDRHRDR